MHLANGQIIDVVLNDGDCFEFTASVDLVQSSGETLVLTPLTRLDGISDSIKADNVAEAQAEYDLFMLDKQMRLWQEVYQQDRCKQTADDAVKHFNQAFKQ
ncbi:MAG: hypothetical protein ACXADH_15415 [Candidatus Kariarchaeaceae archaeon]|jgi:hypothetical protein